MTLPLVAPSATYLNYQPLGASEIRILRFDPRPNLGDGDPANDAQHLPFDLSFEQCSLTETTLPSFVALSYAWGEEKTTVSLQVSKINVKITPNLHTILCTLCQNGPPQRLWIDAICIDQSDTTERALQVQLMRHVYGRASSVHVFLSHTSEPFDVGIGFLERAASHEDEHFEPTLSPTLMSNGLTMYSAALRDSLIAFFSGSWWTRIWTVQEFVLARKVVFLCGQRSVEGETVTKAFNSLRFHERNCCWAAAQTADARGYLDKPSAANNGLSIFRAMLRWNQLQVVSDLETYTAADLLSILASLRSRVCSDPRDRIYGVLGLKFKDEQIRKAIQISYEISASELFRSLALTIIRQSESLNILSHVLPSSIAAPRVQGLPSWVPDWSAGMDALFHLMYSERTDLVNRYRATGGSKPSWTVKDTSTVATQAMFLGKIVTHAPGYPSSHHEISGKKLLDLWEVTSNVGFTTGKGPNAAETEPIQRLNSNLVVLMTGNLTVASWSAGRDGQLFKSANLWHDWFTSDGSASLPEETRNQVREMDNLVRISSLHRRLFRTDSGWLGFGPESLQDGDEVVLIPGGRVPYVLRQCKPYANVTYEFLGDAFVKGVTEGQVSMDEAKLTHIELR